MDKYDMLNVLDQQIAGARSEQDWNQSHADTLNGKAEKFSEKASRLFNKSVSFEITAEYAAETVTKLQAVRDALAEANVTDGYGYKLVPEWLAPAEGTIHVTDDEYVNYTYGP